jgi:hypothetical protein
LLAVAVVVAAVVTAVEEGGEGEVEAMAMVGAGAVVAMALVHKEWARVAVGRAALGCSVRILRG